jgi:beta-glucosidase
LGAAQPSDRGSVARVPPSIEAFADDAAFAARQGMVIPEPEPLRPFHRELTVGDISEVPVGAGLRRLVLKVLPRLFSGGGDEELDASTMSMLEKIVDEMPLRSMVLLSDGRISWRAVDRLVAALNRWPVRFRRQRR